MAMVFVLIMAMPVSAQDRQLRQVHSIEIEVECLEMAVEVIRGLNGYNLEASVFLNESLRHGAERWGMFERRVDYWAYAHVQEVLRGLGDVVNESQNALFLGAQIVEADALITALTQEMERLAAMLAASDSLDVLMAIDSRLSQVTLDRNSAIGTRNVLAAQAANPVINIILNEIPEGRPPVVPDRFGSRVSGTFMTSLRTTGEVLGHMLVFVARVSVPAVIYAALAFVAIYGCVKYKRKRSGVLALQTVGAESRGEHSALTAAYGPETTAESWIIPPEPAVVDEKEGEK